MSFSRYAILAYAAALFQRSRKKARAYGSAARSVSGGYGVEAMGADDLMDAETGRTVAVMDGGYITAAYRGSF